MRTGGRIWRQRRTDLRAFDTDLTTNLRAVSKEAGEARKGNEIECELGSLSGAAPSNTKNTESAKKVPGRWRRGLA
jgi:hypothetical protein